MQVLEQGGSVVLEADEWINKTSGRGDLRLIAHPAGDGDAIEGQFTVFFGLRPYAEALPEFFPWADLHLDEDAPRTPTKTMDGRDRHLGQRREALRR